jgi:hypothetical protein
VLDYVRNVTVDTHLLVLTALLSYRTVILIALTDNNVRNASLDTQFITAIAILQSQIVKASTKRLLFATHAIQGTTWFNKMGFNHAYCYHFIV